MKHLSKSLVTLLAAVVLLAGCTKKSSEKQILSFSFHSPEVEATIMESSKIIVATMPSGTDVTALVPIITVSEKASVNPASGLPQDFTHPVTYTVTAEDGSQASYTVTVTVENGGGGGNGGGSSNGRFSVSATQKVDFAPGNLQYNRTTNKWSFMAHQYDIVETNGQDVGENYANQNVVSLFGWGTWTGSSPNPCNTSTTGSYTFAPADFQGTITGYESHTWYTLTKNEWEYVFNIRSTPSGIRYAKAQVNGVNGMILLPDNWSASTYMLRDTNVSDTGFSSNVINASQWTTLENAGAVFLPAAGRRNGTSVDNEGSSGIYWSASYFTSDYVYCLSFNGDIVNACNDGVFNCYCGRSVRLVCFAQ